MTGISRDSAGGLRRPSEAYWAATDPRERDSMFWWCRQTPRGSATSESRRPREDISTGDKSNDLAAGVDRGNEGSGWHCYRRDAVLIQEITCWCSADWNQQLTAVIDSNRDETIKYLVTPHAFKDNLFYTGSLKNRTVPIIWPRLLMPDGEVLRLPGT